MVSFSNFQRGLLNSPRCKGCSRRCVVLYDRHHEEFFSETCGKVIMDMGLWCVDYLVDYDLVFNEYDVRFKEQRKKRCFEESRRGG